MVSVICCQPEIFDVHILNFARFIRCGSPVPKTKEDADLSSLLGQSVAIAVVEDPANISNSPMHTKEFQILSESTLDVAAAAAEFVESTEAEIVEFVDVPTDVHPLYEVSCGTSCPVNFCVYFELYFWLFLEIFGVFLYLKMCPDR